MVSGNDAAVALAEFFGGDISGFADMMNQKASDLGLTSTHFTSPHGLDQDEHYTTAYELALITDYALKNEVFKKIVKTQSYTITIDSNSKVLHNTNELLGYLDGVYGVKTGFTNGANRCLVTSCKRGNLDIICVVLGCDTKKDRSLDSIKLINYVFDNFSVVNIKEILEENFSHWQTQNSNSFNINKGIYQDLELYLNHWESLRWYLALLCCHLFSCVYFMAKTMLQPGCSTQSGSASSSAWPYSCFCGTYAKSRPSVMDIFCWQQSGSRPPFSAHFLIISPMSSPIRSTLSLNPPPDSRRQAPRSLTM